MKRIKSLLSKSGEKMIIVQSKDSMYHVFTAEEYAYGNGYRSAEFEDISNLEEALSQAINF